MTRLQDGMGINDAGHLTLGGCDATELAALYGTPLYVMDENVMRARCREFRAAMDRYFQKGRVMFASKAFNNKAMCALVLEEGLGIDTVSGGELYTALAAGARPEQLELHGNSKTRAEIEMAVDNGIYRIIADGFDELTLIEQVCREKNRQIDISLRLRPNIDVHAHHAVQTARMDCKFGFGISDGQAIRAARIVAGSRYMNLKGIHCHIGSQIFDAAPFGILVEHLVSFACRVREETGVTLEEFNCGGGFGVRYTDADTPKPFEDFLKLISQQLTKLCREQNYPLPAVSIEPGRAIVGEAGTTLYNVNGLKEITGVRTYCMCDGGMFDNIRTALYDAEYTAVCANRMKEEHESPVSIAGKCCESGDMITWNSPMPASLAVGDTLAVFTTGAYNYSMASNYNRNPVPAVVFVRDGKHALAVRRQSFEDLTRNDLLVKY